MSAGVGARFKSLRAVLAPLYKLYELWLWRQIKQGPVPRHVAIIPDGNRRWAKERGWSAVFGHVEGYKKMREVMRWLDELGVKYVTIYAMSKENCTRRKPEEREHLFSIIKQGLEELLESREVWEKRLKVRVIGRLSLVPDEVRRVAELVEEKTASNDGGVLYVALCYGGRDEIIDAVRRLVADALSGRVECERIDEDLFREYLFTSEAPDPDLVIRTSGEERISNFLLWQLAYSELYFADVYWPSFRKIDLWRAVRSFQQRERRFGS
ncbi:MAG: polyprenyl diphosphate synthase [Fervidicoccaceae archaeon]